MIALLSLMFEEGHRLFKITLRQTSKKNRTVSKIEEIMRIGDALHGRMGEEKVHAKSRTNPGTWFN